MKILCINNKPDFSFYTKRGLNLEVTYDTCNKVFNGIKTSTAITSDNKTVDLYSPDVESYLNETYKEPYDIILFGWNPQDYGTEFASTGGQTFRNKLKNGAYFATCRQGGNNVEIHEMMHLIGVIIRLDLKKYDAIDQMDSMIVNGKVLRYYKNNDPEALDGNYAVTWNSYKKYLPELNNLNKQMTKYRYFSAKEIVGLKPELVEKLDKARGIAGFPFVIVSGFRTPEKNKAVGGVEDSAHLSGLACDLRCDTSDKMYKMLFALHEVGFNRFGINKTTIHVDCDPTKAKNVIWTYYK